MEIKNLKMNRLKQNHISDSNIKSMDINDPRFNRHFYPKYDNDKGF